MEDFAIGWQGHSASLVYGLTDFVPANLPRPRAESNAAVAVHSADVRARNAHQRMLDRNAGHVFRMLHRFLNAADGLVELGNHALAQASRFADAVTAITQSVLAQFGHQDGGLGAAYVNGGDEIGLVARH